MKNKKLILVGLLIAIQVSFFWLSSRYPALNEKALMGGEVDIQGISFDIVYEPDAGQSPLKQTWINTLNWLETNKKGMIFGLFLASSLILLFSLLSKKGFKSRFSNTLLGIAIGTPLGVCVNCVAPIAQGMRKAGAEKETALATMLSSPTLNVIVLTMLFSLMPIYIALLKVTLTLLMILIGVPLLIKYFDKSPLLPETAVDAHEAFQQRNLLPINFSEFGMDEGWANGLKWTVVNYLKSLWYIVRKTVPLMLLAGLLGNILVTFLPWNVIVDFMTINTLSGIVIVMLLTALIGTFLPVPIAFDIIIAAIFLASGVPEAYVMLLLFTLGIFSIYSFFIVRQTFSTKLAIAVFILTMAVGGLGATIIHPISVWSNNRDLELYEEYFSGNSSEIPVLVTHRPEGITSTQRIETQTGVESKTEVIYAQGNLEIREKAFEAVAASPAADPAKLNLNMLFGDSLGLKMPTHFSVEDILEPYSHGRGIASGDLNKDGWPDIAIASNEGLFIYVNQKGKAFSPYHFQITMLNGAYIYGVAIVDINNDQWPDLFVTTYQRGNYIFYSDTGNFSDDNFYKLPDPGIALTVAPAFGDVDMDGDLDIVLGNWAIGATAPRDRSFKIAQNYLLLQEADTFKVVSLEGLTGETLSTVIADINQDGKPDLVVGNDFDIPDAYYLGDGKGGLERVKDTDGIVQKVTQTTMSVTTADIDNDSKAEVFHTQNSRFENFNRPYATSDVEVISRSLKGSPGFAQYKRILQDHERIMRSRFSKGGLRSGNQLNESILAYRLLTDVRIEKITKNKSTLCDYLPASWTSLTGFCEFDFNDTIAYSSLPNEALIETKNSNVLNVFNEGEGFTDRAADYGIAYSGWSWSGKFADLNNDEWQDLYVVNGFLWRVLQDCNLFYQNNGEAFEDVTRSESLKNYLPITSYTYIDYDQDGDMDIVAPTTFGPILVYQNTLGESNSIAIQLKDELGNSAGIGSKIIIHYGEDGAKTQMREVQSGGAFKSFDNPVAFFGLGKYTNIKSVEVHWSTGQIDFINEHLNEGGNYVIHRKQ